MIKIIFLVTESYLITLLLQLAHGNPLFSEHTLLVSILGALIFLLIGGGGTLIIYIFSYYFKWKKNVAYISWVLSIAIFGITLIIGAQPNS